MLIIKYLIMLFFEAFFNSCVFIFGALWEKAKIAKKEQQKNELIGKWVQPTGEKLYATHDDPNGHTIPKFVKNDYSMVTNIENDRVLLCKPIGWVHKDEITWNVRG